MLSAVSAIPFDRSVLKVNQIILMAGILAGYLLSLSNDRAAIILPVLAAMMLAGVVSPQANVPRLLYLHVLRPAGLVKPRVAVEDPAPHRFAQLVGGVFLVAASITALAGAFLAGWVLAWIVLVLAFLNFAFNICVGCIMYAQLVRIGVFPLRRASAT